MVRRPEDASVRTDLRADHEFGVFAGPANNNEDCLYLNVFTPNLDPSAKLPVIVWIHGGGNIDGEAPGYDGSKMASDGKTVVVTLAYRLNLMGWIAHPALDAEGHLLGDYGVLDQQAVLKWVQRNIAKFGGDKNNVTLGGQSAGAVDTGFNMVSPLAKGLFQRALCESYCPIFPVPTKTAGEALGVGFSVAAGCGSGTGAATAKCLRNLTAAQVEALAGTASAQSQYISGQGVVDGQIIPDQPLTLFANGNFNHMPLMNGNTSRTKITSTSPLPNISRGRRACRSPRLNTSTTSTPPMPHPLIRPERRQRFWPAIRLSAYASPQLAWDRLGTDPGNCSERRLDKVLAPQIPVYAYEFEDQTAPFYFPKMPGFLSLAYHTADIQYLFPLWHGGPNGIQQP